MNKLTLLVTAVLLAAGVARARAAEKLPNIVIIFTDDQGYADVGKFGAEGFTTPNLDRMADEGAVFRNFHVAQPVCSASRCALMTGCYPNRLGIHGALGPKSKVGISDREVTLAQVLKSRGYATAMFGKWHLGDSPQFMPLRHGFDEYFGESLSVDMWPGHPDLITNLPANLAAMKREYPKLPIWDGEKKFRDEMTIDDLNHLTTWYAERAVRFIDRHKTKPFFLYVAHNMPHVPLGVSDKFRGQTKRGLYGDVIEEIDWSVGQILEALKRNGLEDNTLVIFTSDNGLVMQFVDGKNLSTVVKEHSPLPISKAVDYIIQAARGLQYAHEQGIVHRDIKPGNLLLDKRGTVKILDMGLARVGGAVDEEDQDRLTASGQVMGSVDYMAPEQAVDTHHADARADVYSLGCTLYRLLTNEVLYKGDTLVKILISHQQSPIPSLCQVRADVSPQLNAVFQKMVAKKPEDRQQTMTEVMAELEACVGNRETTVAAVNEGATADYGADNLSFLKTTAPRSMTTTAKKKGEKVAEMTLSQQAAASETSKQLPKDEQLQAAPRKKKTLIVAVAAGLLGVVGVVSVYRAITIRVERPDGSKMVIQVPDDSKVTVTNDGEGKSAAKQASYGPGAPPLAKPSMSSSEAAQVQKQWAAHLGIPVEQINSIGMKLTLIPPGEFEMGSTNEEIQWANEEARKGGGRENDRASCEGPQHRVKITKPFYAAMYPVTQGEYTQVMGVNPSSFTTTQMDASAFNPPLSEADVSCRRDQAARVAGKDTGRHPVEMVAWDEAMEFCRRLSASSAARTAKHVYRLPTEAEWEYACRGGSTTRWSFGNDEVHLCDHAWFNKNANAMTHPVGEKQPNAWGMCDMGGNVGQWCADWFSAEYYKQSPPSDPLGPPTGTARILRGGNWGDPAFACRSASRYFHTPASRYARRGFRVVCEIAPKAADTKQPADNMRGNIDFMPLIDTQKDGVLGKWTRTADGITVTKANEATVLRLPYLPPEEYDFEVEFTPHGDGMNVNQYVAAGGRSFAWKLNSHGKQPPLYGFELLDGKFAKDLAEASVHKPRRMESGRRYTSRVEVRRGSLRALVDGEEYVKWSGDLNRFSMEPITRLDDDGWVGVGSYKRGVVFHRISVREVTGRGKFTRGTAQQANNTRQPADYAAWKKDAIDLLPLIDPQKDLVGGTWVAGTRGLEATDIKCMSQKIQPPYRPAEEYDYRVSFTPIVGNADVAVGLTAKGRSFAFYMKRYASDHCSGFECINGKIIASGPTARRFPHLELGRRYTVFVEVRKDGLKAWLDRELMAQWATDYHDMSPFRVWKFKDDTLLGFGCSLSRVIFHEIQVREVTGKGEFTRGAPKAHAVDDAFIKEVAALPAEQQVARVIAKLKELNPGFDPVAAKETHKIDNGAVTELAFKTEHVADISPVRALASLRDLSFEGRTGSQLCDLSPLCGLHLISFNCGGTGVRDLSPLAGMPLASLNCTWTEVEDLGPLKGMPLEKLECYATKIHDLSPLAGMKLKILSCMSHVRDLTPLIGMPLTDLHFDRSQVNDLSPLKGMPLKAISRGFTPERDAAFLRSIKTLEKINQMPVAEFWKQTEAGKIPPPK